MQSEKITIKEIFHPSKKKISVNNKEFLNKEAEIIVKNFFETVKSHLVNGNIVKIKDFGTFTPEDREEKPGNLPTTGEPITIPKRRVVLFAGSIPFKRDLKEVFKEESAQKNKKNKAKSKPQKSAQKNKKNSPKSKPKKYSK